MSAVARVIESTLGGLIGRMGIRTVAFEVTQRCDQDCSFCYNVWKRGDYPSGELDTRGTEELLNRVITDYRPHLISFTGGEPLLRDDLAHLIRHVARRAHCNLISNGALMTDEAAAELVEAGVKTFEFTLLSARREVHNSLVRADSFDRLIEGIASVKAAGGTVATTFVATKANIADWAETLELNVALGVSGILFNRFNVGGAGVENAADLTPSVEQVRDALAIADEGSRRYGIGISCGVPILPCVIDTRAFRRIGFTGCPVGGRNSYPAVDPVGNVRPCNHSPSILGNLFDSSFGDIIKSDAARHYASGWPSECNGCKDVRKCRGGCRAAAEVCGNGCAIDPFATQYREMQPLRKAC